ncbi:transglutaminase domain-containing protein, partial [candidate division KSB1 bacterium]|nr:transglutaminase domain-containing protein [candidate division KSB1 bacterium]
GKGWCTQFGQIWTFFANRAGIPTRLLQGARTQDNTFVYTGHTWAESWIAEQQRWAFVDLSHAYVAVFDKAGRVLNTVELFSLNSHDAFDGVTARIVQDWEWKHLQAETGPDSLATVPFALCNRVVRQQFTPHSIFKWRRPPNVEDVRMITGSLFKDAAFGWSNVERYLFKPPLAYSLYPTEGKATYFLRWALFYGLAAVALLGLSIALGRLWRR